MSHELLKLISEKFTSGNSVEVERITITRADYQEALAKPEQKQKLIGWINGEPQYAKPEQEPRKEWVGLTDDEILAFVAFEPHPLMNRTSIIRAVEAKLKELNQ